MSMEESRSDKKEVMSPLVVSNREGGDGVVEGGARYGGGPVGADRLHRVLQRSHEHTRVNTYTWRCPRVQLSHKTSDPTNLGSQ